jgi:hypothetical protein
MFNSLTFFSFAIARGNGLMQAISVALVDGLIFTVTAVSMALYFRQSHDKDAAQEKRELDYA